MSYVIAAPDMLAASAADVAGIGSSLSGAHAAAAASTTRVIVAAGDECRRHRVAVSSHGQQFQAISAQERRFRSSLAGVDRGCAILCQRGGRQCSAFTAPTIGLVMGGSGIPIPGPGYVALADQLYIHPNFPATTYPNPYANGLFTPEYPVISVPFSLNYPAATTGPLAGFPAPFTSVGQGMLILENAIASNLAAGHASTVFGWSQSASISGLVMQQLDPTGVPMPNHGLQFVLIGDPNAPNGGVFERFNGLTLPSVGLSFDGATPSNSFPTNIYTIEYDGFADWPRYPINFLADLNASLGLVSIHGLYLTPSIISPTVLSQAVLLPGSELLGADTLTNYYMIPLSALPSPHDYLPLLQPLANTPIIGKPLADLLQPDLTVLVNLGYGDPNFGYSTSPANVPTPFGLFPHVSQALIAQDLVTGAKQGVAAFVSDIHSEAASGLSLSSLSHSLSSLPSPTHLSTALLTAASNPSATRTDIVNAFSSAGSALYSPLLATADLINAAVTSIPNYDVSLFLANLSNPVDAIGLPIAADVGLITWGPRRFSALGPGDHRGHQRHRRCDPVGAARRHPDPPPPRRLSLR